MYLISLKNKTKQKTDFHEMLGPKSMKNRCFYENASKMHLFPILHYTCLWLTGRWRSFVIAFWPDEEWISESWNTTGLRFVATAFGGSRISWYNSQWRPQYTTLFNQKPRDTHWLNWCEKLVSISWLLIDQKMCTGLFHVMYLKKICLSDTAGADFVW